MTAVRTGCCTSQCSGICGISARIPGACSVAAAATPIPPDNQMYNHLRADFAGCRSAQVQSVNMPEKQDRQIVAPAVIDVLTTDFLRHPSPTYRSGCCPHARTHVHGHNTQSTSKTMSRLIPLCGVPPPISYLYARLRAKDL